MPSYQEVNARMVYYRRLCRVKMFVEENYGLRIKLRTVARIAGLDPKYFSTYFKLKTGVCFRDWLAWVRAERAIAMMKANNYRISEITFAVGYADLRIFERAFKRVTGLTPKECKSQVRP